MRLGGGETGGGFVGSCVVVAVVVVLVMMWSLASGRGSSNRSRLFGRAYGEVSVWVEMCVDLICVTRPAG
jgi:hypothetical protein